MAQDEDGILEALLRAPELLFKALFKKAPDGIVIVKAGPRIVVDANDQFCRLTGFDIEEIIGSSTLSFQTKESHARIKQEVEKHLNGELDLIEEVEIKRKDGAIIYCDITASSLKLPDSGYPECIIAFYRDVTRSVRARIAQEHEHRLIQEMAIRDSLTGTFNRHYLSEMMPIEQIRSKRQNYRIGFLMIDVNGFKKINDSYGHQTGDKVLAEIGSALMKCVRPYDSVIRYGGDEFLIVIPGGGDNVGIIKERIKQNIAGNEILKGILGCPAKIAVGTYIYDPKEEKTIEQVIGEADRHMYMDKNGG